MCRIGFSLLPPTLQFREPEERPELGAAPQGAAGKHKTYCFRPQHLKEVGRAVHRSSAHLRKGTHSENTKSFAIAGEL